jgi:hypothetical protein
VIAQLPGAQGVNYTAVRNYTLHAHSRAAGLRTPVDKTVPSASRDNSDWPEQRFDLRRSPVIRLDPVLALTWALNRKMT